MLSAFNHTKTPGKTPKTTSCNTRSEARTAATVWNWSGETLSPGALLAVLYFSFVPYFSACLDFPSPPLSAPGSPRMVLIESINHLAFAFSKRKL